MNNIPLLQCYQLSKSYQEGKYYINVLRNINFTLQYNEMTAIIGASGSGKSTLLHLLGGMDKPSSGKVVFKGRLMHELSSSELALLRNQQLGFIYQFHHLLADFNALENVAMPLLINGIKSNIAQKKAREMLLVVGLEKRCYHRPAELSGGERQRVSIARALVNNPALVLADEPTGNLDRCNTDIVFELLNKLNTYQGTAFLIATHDLQLAKKLCRQLEIRDGILLENI